MHYNCSPLVIGNRVVRRRRRRVVVALPKLHINRLLLVSSPRQESSKADKIRLALQKMKEASVKKLFIKVFNDEGGAKSLLVDEGMRCSYVMRLLADKHHIDLGPRWGLVEHLPDLHMGKH